MSAEEKAILETLDRIVRSKEVRSRIQPIVDRVCNNLGRKTEAVMTWEPIPLSTLNEELPSGICSSWVFVLRAGTDTGPERHPNSHQRMMSYAGSGDLQTGNRRPDGEIVWASNVLVSDSETALEQRWVSIPPNVWHRPVVAAEADWVVVSFHTVSAAELIEERPDPDQGTRQMLYLGSEN
jgi:hypothetical protein